MTGFDPLLFIAVASKHVINGMTTADAIHKAAIYYDLYDERWQRFQIEKMGLDEEATLANFIDWYKVMPDSEYPTPEWAKPIDETDTTRASGDVSQTVSDPS